MNFFKNFNKISLASVLLLSSIAVNAQSVHLICSSNGSYHQTFVVDLAKNSIVNFSGLNLPAKITDEAVTWSEASATGNNRIYSLSRYTGVITIYPRDSTILPVCEVSKKKF